jgi:hypothetical protein
MATVFVNGRGVAHGTSGGQSLVFPNVCLTPSGSGAVPVPYPSLGQSSDTSNGPESIAVDGAMPMVKGAKYQRTSSDEPGSQGGIISGSFNGEAEFMTYSFDVKFEDENVCRLGDSLFHNRRNTMG